MAFLVVSSPLATLKKFFCQAKTDFEEWGPGDLDALQQTLHLLHFENL